MVQGLRAPGVQNYEVQLAGLPASSDGTVLILASDFHLGTLLGEDWLSARIDQIHAERPDIIILDGDIVEGDDASSAMAESTPPATSAHPRSDGAIRDCQKLNKVTRSTNSRATSSRKRTPIQLAPRKANHLAPLQAGSWGLQTAR